MVDLLDREIKIGDIVAIADSKHADMYAGVVTNITKKKIRVSTFYVHNKYDENNKELICTYDKVGWTDRNPEQVVIMNTDRLKIIDRDEYYRQLKESHN